MQVGSSAPQVPGPPFYGMAVLEDHGELRNASYLIEARQETRIHFDLPEPGMMEAVLRKLENA